MAHEIELRFSASAEDLAKLARSRALKDFSPGRAKIAALSTVYYDTPDLALAQCGLSLRVRKQGRRFVQTVKGENAGGLASDRMEVECPLVTGEPDLQRIDDADLRQRLVDLTSEATLSPIVATDIRRTTRLLSCEAGAVELAIDRGEIRTLRGMSAILPVTEIELESKAGSPAILYAIARAMLAQAPLTVATESKSERGLRALRGLAPAPTKAGRATLSEDATAEDAFRETLIHCMRHIARNAPLVAEARDAEGLHQLRVGLRRLRAALDAFGEAFRTAAVEDLRIRAKAFADSFGATRELDVFAEDLLQTVENETRMVPGIASLRLALETVRCESWDHAAALARDPIFVEFLLDLASCAEERGWHENASAEYLAYFAQGASEAAARALDAQQRKVRKRARHLARLEPQARHRLRIALKKLRYVAEFFAPLFAEKDVAAYLKQLSKAQDVFGALNDSSTADHTLQRIFAHAGPDAAPDLREGAAFVAGWHAGRVAPAWKKARKRWKSLEKTEPFWRT